MSVPFVVAGLPRSRTAWLAHFLSVPHEPSLRMLEIADLDAILRNERGGCSDCMMAWLWRDIEAIEPGTRFVVVRRPVGEVTASLARLGVSLAPWFLPGMSAMLDEIEHETEALSVAFDDLRQEDVCRAVWEHCRSEPFDRSRWVDLSTQNIQSDITATLKLIAAREQVLGELFCPKFMPHVRAAA